MEIKLNNLSLGDNEHLIDGFNFLIPTDKIIALYGNLRNSFIEKYKNNALDTDDYDNEYLTKVLRLNNYNHFITNNVKDELYLNIKDYILKEKKIIEVLEYFNLNSNFLNKDIYTLADTEKKIVKLIIIAFSDYKTIFISRLFNGLDYNNIKLFKKFIKLINDEYKKLVFIHEDNIDLIYSFVDKIMIVDTNLLAIESRHKMFEKENIDKVVDISIPKIYEFQKLLEEKGFKIKNCYSMKDLIREVKKNV